MDESSRLDGADDEPDGSDIGTPTRPSIRAQVNTFEMSLLALIVGLSDQILDKEINDPAVNQMISDLYDAAEALPATVREVTSRAGIR